MVDYRTSLLTAEEQSAMERFYQAMFAEGVVLTPELAGCLSTPMTDAEVSTLTHAAERAFDAIGLA